MPKTGASVQSKTSNANPKSQAKTLRQGFAAGAGSRPPPARPTGGAVDGRGTSEEQAEAPSLKGVKASLTTRKKSWPLMGG